MLLPPIIITSEGWAENSRRLKRVERILGDEITSMLVEAVTEIIGIMKILMSAHYPPASLAGNPPAQRTGALWDSIDIAEISKNRVVFEMLKYGLYLDQGTATIQPRPFLTPALLELIDRFPEIVVQRVDEALR